MAKIEFSEHEIEILKKVAEEYKSSGQDSAQTLLANSGITIETSPAVQDYFNAPDMSNADNGDGCYACISCLFFAFVAFANYAK